MSGSHGDQAKGAEYYRQEEKKVLPLAL